MREFIRTYRLAYLAVAVLLIGSTLMAGLATVLDTSLSTSVVEHTTPSSSDDGKQIQSVELDFLAIISPTLQISTNKFVCFGGYVFDFCMPTEVATSVLSSQLFPPLLGILKVMFKAFIVHQAP